MTGPFPVEGQCIVASVDGGTLYLRHEWVDAACRRCGRPRLREALRARPLVVVESPYREGDAQAVRYARAALRDCIDRGETPIASHLLYTQPGVLRDEDAAERLLGMEMGWQLYSVAALSAVYSDLGVSVGMRAGIEAAQRRRVPIVYRTIQGWEKK